MIPQAKVARFPRPRAERHRTAAAYLTAEQAEKILQVARDEFGPKAFAMFLFSYSHGARVSEIANLRISDLNFRQGTVHVQRLKGSLESTQPFMKVKGSSLYDEEKAFRAWLAIRQDDADSFVFNTQKSTKIDRSTIFRVFQNVCQKAGIPEALRHVHVLKHSVAMRLVERNTQAFMIRTYLGHKSFDSTLRYVNGNEAQANREAIRAFSQI
jgi:integrase